MFDKVRWKALDGLMVGSDRLTGILAPVTELKE